MRCQYSIIPVVGPDKDHLRLSQADASAQTPPMTITGQASAHISAYFNKGIVSAQWVTRALASVGKGAKLDTLIGQSGNSLRNALSGLLRPQLLDLLDDVKKNDGEIYAALYELNDPELIPALIALGQKCHLILANGAFNSKKPDENSAVRAQLRGKVDLHDRLVGSGHFAHNKFIVACDSAGQAAARPVRQHQLDEDRTVHPGQQRHHRGRPGSGRAFHRSMESAQSRRKRLSRFAHASELDIRSPSTSMAARSRNGSRQPTRARTWTTRAS